MKIFLLPRHLLTLCLLLSVAGLSAQFGLSGFRNFNDLRFSGDAVDPNHNSLPYADGTEVALNYWFRLPKQRIEFQPTAYYVFPGEMALTREAGLQFKTNIYVFDLGTDCDCPTFGKQGPQLEKGFFLQLAPGAAYHWNTSALASDGKVVPTIGAGLGIDFGISNLLTLTPIASLRRTFGEPTEIDIVDENNQDIDSRARLTTFQLGLQATFRLDRKRY